LLPDEVTEEQDDEVVVGPDEAAEKGDELCGRDSTRMERVNISILWSRAGSIVDYLRDDIITCYFL
jgi:hypothetical protein